VRPVPERAFYCVADAAYFPGLLAVVNSLRLAGHDDPVVVLDCGLEPAQRDRLAGHAELLAEPPGGEPVLLKWTAPRRRPADVMVLLDTDMVVVRSLEPLLALAAEGKVVAFADLLAERFDDGWADVLGVPTLEPRTYVNAGFLVLPGALAGLLERLEEIQELMPRGEVETPTGPREVFKFRDQDALNAVLAAEVPAEDVVTLERRLAPVQPYPGLRVADVARCECRYSDGEQPYVLHHLNEKPWLARTPPNPYSQLLARLLLGDDVAIRLSPEELPLHLRPGAAADVVRGALSLDWLATRAWFKLRLLAGR
jgi:hypothetical protein